MKFEVDSHPYNRQIVEILKIKQNRDDIKDPYLFAMKSRGQSNCPSVCLNSK